MIRVYDTKLMEFYKEEIISYIKDVIEINKETIEDKNKISNKRIRESLERRFENLKIGKNVNATEIGNNTCYELIDRGRCEKIFGYLHLIDNISKGMVFFLGDIDDICITEIIEIKP